MKYDDNDHYILSSGKTFYAHGGVIGLGMTQGWDGGIDDSSFTKAERKEIARFCRKEWKEYGRKG